MVIIDVDPITEVRSNRELLLEKYGGIGGLHKHMDEERPRLEAQGWVFVPLDTIIAKKRARIVFEDTASGCLQQYADEA
ncbi:MAG: hypothetical protein FWD25_10890 [Clostridia bacterium]|nr:hypothetical protein [Clostridia bacterium]